MKTTIGRRRTTTTQLKASARLRWAVEGLAVRSTDRLLEIGCGHGVAAALVCAQLETGSLLAIDRSPTMIAAAQRRNAAHVAAGRVVFQAAPLHEAALGEACFDTVFAIRIAALLRNQPTRELGIVRDCLAANGRFHLIYDPPSAQQVASLLANAVALLEGHGFDIQAAATHTLAARQIVRIVAGRG
jgi:protein-L-isoaspartate O-methyltransferase